MAVGLRGLFTIYEMSRIGQRLGLETNKTQVIDFIRMSFVILVMKSKEGDSRI